MSLVHRRCQGLLAQFFSRRVHRDRQVQVLWNRQAEQTLQIYLARSGIKQIRAAHNMRDALKRIVHHYGKLICKQVICALDHEIADLAFETLVDAALQFITEDDRFNVCPYPPGSSFASGRNALATSAWIYRSFDPI
jgi:hypothetical protein